MRVWLQGQILSLRWFIDSMSSNDGFAMNGRDEWVKLVDAMKEKGFGGREYIESDGREVARANDTIDESLGGRRVVDEFLEASKTCDFAGKNQIIVGDFSEDTPVCTVTHENKLLCEPHNVNLGDGRSVRMRPCIMGESCVGRSKLIEGHEESGGGVVLREMLFPKELTDFEMSGQLPDIQKPCVLCSRQHMMQAYVWCMNHNDFARQNVIVNWYVNPRDCNDGYIGDYTIPYENVPGWNCIIGHVAVNRLSKMRLVKRNKVWWIDQSELTVNKAF